MMWNAVFALKFNKRPGFTAFYESIFVVRPVNIHGNNLRTAALDLHTAASLSTRRDTLSQAVATRHRPTAMFSRLPAHAQLGRAQVVGVFFYPPHLTPTIPPRHINPSHQHINPSHQHINPSHQHINPSHQHINPPHQHINHSHQYINPSHRHFNPSHQHINPSRSHINPSRSHINPSRSHINISRSHITSTQYTHTIHPHIIPPHPYTYSRC